MSKEPSANTMRAVVFKGPYSVAVEDRPIPQIQEPTDIIAKVQYAGLCGTELHMYRGHQKTPTDFIIGHEFNGTVIQVGADVKTLKVGDKITCPFSTTCGECFYCKKNLTSRCVKAMLIGTAALDGAQAEFVRVPLADSTAVISPPDIDDKVLVMMADILPTGYFAASNGFRLLTEAEREDAVIAVVGLGPVGLCALVSASTFKPKHIFAIESVPARLQQAKDLGAEPLNFQTDMEGLKQRVAEVTEGRGVDLILEIVGLSPALRLGFDILRPWGVISSVGVHNGEVPWTANEAYHKNLRLQTGRCPVRAVFPQALEVLKQFQDRFSFMTDNIVSIEQAVRSYERFEKAEVQKIIFSM
ncbi:GroES-like protein [Rhizodiscina lignyota]|uniref:GroES-like protein n=1 Tax=Rhizodiscina lignyota TaxID=1504668 RepID=A0A9P4M7N2_9PEZI|nr:GroES-like protein [Rhizodiscina lignyota]